MSPSASKAQNKLENWIRRLLDLSRQNPQLYYDPKAKNNVEIIHGTMETVFKVLVVFGQPCEFVPVWKPKQKKGAAKDQSDAEEISEPATSQPIGSAHELAIEKKKAKSQLNELITNLNDNLLNNRLTNLLRKASTLEEEKGVPALYCTFGILKWYETANDNDPLWSPILFVPVRLIPGTSLANYQLQIVNDDIIINPTLKVKLKQKLNIELPEFGTEYDTNRLVGYLQEIKSLLDSDPRWEIQNRMCLDLFIFEKIALYTDLDSYRTQLLAHPIIRAIADEKGYKEAKENLPTEDELSDGHNPLDSYLILDSDSSQWEAIQYAKHGTSLVIQGPPGTGKSQCITNIIAECLGANKKVLFVAEKKAAIEVVKKRLEKCGLGEFCLEIHSQNANKVEVLKQLENCLDFDHKPQNVSEIEFKDLKIIREKLNQYVLEINQLRGDNPHSIFDIIGQELNFAEVPLLNFTFPSPFTLTENQMVEIKSLLRDLQRYASLLEDYDRNPWNLSKITTFDENLKEQLNKLLKEFLRLNNQLQSNLSNLKDLFPENLDINADATTSVSLKDWDQISPLLSFWMKTLGFYDKWVIFEDVYRQVTQSFLLDWDRPPYIFESFIQIAQLYPDIDKKILGSKLISQFEVLSQKIDVVKNAIETFNKSGILRPISDLDDLQQYISFFAQYTPKALSLVVDYYLTQFKTKYNGKSKQKGDDFKRDKQAIDECLVSSENTPDYLQHLDQIKKFQEWIQVPTKNPAIDDQITLLLTIQSDITLVMKLKQELDNIVKIPPIDVDQCLTILGTFSVFVDSWFENMDAIYEWCEIQKYRQMLNEKGLGGFFEQIKNRSFGKVEYGLLFERAYYHYWLKDAIKKVPEIENFKKEYYANLHQSFVDLDQKILKLNQERLREKLFALWPKSDLGLSDALLEQIGMIKREIKKKRNIKPLRAIFTQAKEYLTMVKPCFMMSPMSVAEFLTVDKYERYFDLIIFDEASQIGPEDAIGAILRGKQLIVVGDSKQLPPTPFFAAKHDDEFDESALESEAMESILDEIIGIGFREKMLRYHYRSRKEGLIAFSNHKFYGGQLYTFPEIARPKIGTLTPSIVVKTPGITFESFINSLPAVDYRYIANGIYEKRKNIEEAQAIAHAIVDHYQMNQKLNVKLSLGVVAFSQSQQEAIQNELDKILQKSPDLQIILSQQQSEEPLFIKNLESVQGDERDFIFFSIGYGKDPQGHINYNFGPLNRSGGFRRLNVAITRAKYHCKIFCSFLPSDIHLDRVQAEGLIKLVEYLDYARTGKIQTAGSKSPQKTSIIDHPFENNIRNYLQGRGYLVDQTIGTSNFKIDLAVVDPADTNKYKLAIECDGGSFGNTIIARDRERLRPQVLKGLGWILLHIWAPLWYQNKQELITQMEQILK